MTKQYNNVIENTLKHEQTEDSLVIARAIFDNMGVALLHGNINTVYETIKTDNYMGWKSCTMQEAQEAANNGTAAIGISEDRIVVLSANDEEQPVTQTASVMALDENTSAFAVDGLQYYSYGYGTTTAPSPHGNYLTFSCTHPAVCNDGIGNSYSDPYHQSQTSYMNGILNADIHRYIVIPKSVSGYANLRGCVGAVVRRAGSYLFGVVGEVGPSRDPGVLDEFSVKMIKDLGFNTNGATYVSPADVVTTYIFTDTKRSSWSSSTLNSDVENVGRNYY